MNSISYGQDTFLSQYTYSPLLANPAFVNLGYDIQAIAHVRNQYRNPNPNFTTPSFSLLYPFVANKNKRWGGLGVSLYGDYSGSFPRFSKQGGSISYAHNIRLKRTMHLSLGIQLGLYDIGIGSGSFSTSSQYSNAVGFDASAPSGETLVPQNKKYFDLASGIVWHGEDTLGQVKYYVGVSIYHINQPDISLQTKQEKLPQSFQFMAGYTIFNKNNWQIIPEIYLTKQQEYFRITSGVRFGYLFHSFLDKKELKTSSISFIPKYHHKQGFGFGLELKLNNLFLMSNYDFQTSAISEKITQNGAYEFVIAYRKSLFKIKEPEPLSDYSLSDLRNFYTYNEVGAISKQLEKSKKYDSTYRFNDTTWHKTNNFKFELEKRFIYGFNETALGEDAKKFANDIAGLMLENPTIKLLILGYTDNVGSEKSNLIISTERAKAFAKYIETKGVDLRRIRFEGKGETEALNTNRTLFERSKNRRVRFLIY
ncbi:MAG: type IX secretion system membrane protein PorP/SprF [Cytophagales bacterium]|nr:MAG: type IX secretion system membrane protein PorP/SprF [Cytophagales bacterium]